jgi:hypothetical protein
VQCTHILVCWPLAGTPQQLAPRSRPGGGEWTPRQLAWNLLQPLLRWVHLPLRTSLSISCTVHNRLSTKYDYQSTCTTRKNLHLQARPDNCHSRGAKYTGDVDKPSFSGSLFFGFSCRWLFSSRGCDRLRPALSDRRMRLDFCSRPLRHKLFHDGGWAAASFNWLPHRLPVTFVPLVYRVGRWNLLQALGILLSAYTTLQDKYSTTLLEEFTS